MLWEKDTVEVGKYDVRVDLNVYFDGNISKCLIESQLEK